ncbi:MAG: hypothetical protein R3B48_15665 [Kofleriaceae bacterium]
MKIPTPFGTAEIQKIEFGTDDLTKLSQMVCELPDEQKSTILTRAKNVCQAWRDIREAYLQGLASGAFPLAVKPSIDGLLRMYTLLIDQCDKAITFVEACSEVRPPAPPPGG